MILYFSGTGNSLALARKVAERTGEQVVSLYEAVGMDLSHEKRIGLVFPTYMLEAPRPVRALAADCVSQERVHLCAYQLWRTDE